MVTVTLLTCFKNGGNGETLSFPFGKQKAYFQGLFAVTFRECCRSFLLRNLQLGIFHRAFFGHLASGACAMVLPRFGDFLAVFGAVANSMCDLAADTNVGQHVYVLGPA